MTHDQPHPYYPEATESFEESQERERLAELYARFNASVKKHQEKKYAGPDSEYVKTVVEALTPITEDDSLLVAFARDALKKPSVAAKLFQFFKTEISGSSPLAYALTQFKADARKNFTREGSLHYFIMGCEKSLAELTKEMISLPAYYPALKLIASSVTEPYIRRNVGKLKRDAADQAAQDEENILTRSEKKAADEAIIAYLRNNPQKTLPILAKMAGVINEEVVTLDMCMTEAEFYELLSVVEKTAEKRAAEDFEKAKSSSSAIKRMLVGLISFFKEKKVHQKLKDATVTFDDASTESVDLSSLNQPGQYILSTAVERTFTISDYFWEHAKQAAAFGRAVEAAKAMQIEVNRKPDDPTLDNAEVIDELVRTRLEISSILERLRHRTLDILAEAGIVLKDLDKTFNIFEVGCVHSFDVFAENLVESISLLEQQHAVDLLAKMTDSYLIFELKKNDYILKFRNEIKDQRVKNLITEETQQAIESLQDVLLLSNLREIIVQTATEKPERVMGTSSEFSFDIDWNAQDIRDGELTDEMVERMARFEGSHYDDELSLDDIAADFDDEPFQGKGKRGE